VRILRLENGITLGGRSPIGWWCSTRTANPADYADCSTFRVPSHADFTYRAKIGIHASIGGDAPAQVNHSDGWRPAHCGKAAPDLFAGESRPGSASNRRDRRPDRTAKPPTRVRSTPPRALSGFRVTEERRAPSIAETMGVCCEGL
jgi:hypothetical protein